MSQYLVVDDYDAWLEVATEYLDSYGVDPDSHLFALKHSGIPIGFAMVNKDLRFNDTGFAMADFYIDKKHQTKGCGRTLAEYVFSQLPGKWEVRITEGNEVAQLFWRRVISGYIDGECKEWSIDSYRGFGFSFSNA